MKNREKDLKKHIDSEFKKALSREKQLIKNKIITNGFKRVIISGESGSGKSMSLIRLFNLIHQPDMVGIYSSTEIKNKDLYKTALKQFPFEPLEIDPELAQLKGVPFVKYFNKCPGSEFLHENQQSLNDMDHSIFIFDDVDKSDLKKKIPPFFTYGRNMNISPILLYQRYSWIDANIRTNANVLCIFRSSQGYDQIWRDVKVFFDHTKRKFDALTTLLHEPENKFRFISIDKENWEDPVKLDFTESIKYKKINKDKYIAYI